MTKYHFTMTPNVNISHHSLQPMMQSSRTWPWPLPQARERFFGWGSKNW